MCLPLRRQTFLCLLGFVVAQKRNWGVELTSFLPPANNCDLREDFPGMRDSSLFPTVCKDRRSTPSLQETPKHGRDPCSENEREGIAHMLEEQIRREELGLGQVGSNSRKNLAGHMRWR